MKKLFVTLIAFLMSFCVFSQITWELSNTTWAITEGMGWSTQYLFISPTQNDTVINLKSYKKVKGCDSIYQFGIRSDSRKVFLVPFDSVNEYLLYDFQALPGDTIHSIITGSNLSSFCEPDLNLKNVVVSAIDSFKVANKTYSIVHIYEPTGGMNNVWFENIGSWFGLLGYINSPSLSNLFCYSNNDTTIKLGFLYSLPNNGESIPYLTGNVCNDSIYMTHINEQTKEIDFSIFPNPASSNITVESKMYQAKSIKIMDVLGIEQYYSQLLSEKTEIDVSQLPNGAYILQVQSKNGFVSKKFVKQ